jgi:hypothetical protein
MSSDSSMLQLRQALGIRPSKMALCSLDQLEREGLSLVILDNLPIIDQKGTRLHLAEGPCDSSLDGPAKEHVGMQKSRRATDILAAMPRLQRSQPGASLPVLLTPARGIPARGLEVHSPGRV